MIAIYVTMKATYIMMRGTYFLIREGDVQDCMSRKILAEQLHMIFSVYAVIMINRLYAANYRQEVTVHCTEHLQFYYAAVMFDGHQFGMD